MKTDYFSCEQCGCVVDVEILKQLDEKKTTSEQINQDYDSSYLYRDYCDFEKIRCPACKKLNQR